MDDIWTFPAGMVGHDESVKGYRVDGEDGPVGVVDWADYKPGESYLVVRFEHGGHVIPAGAVKSVDHEQRRVAVGASVDEVRASGTYVGDAETMYAEARTTLEDQFERGRYITAWPYTDE
jgi:hypothetical protein